MLGNKGWEETWRFWNDWSRASNGLWETGFCSVGVLPPVADLLIDIPTFPLGGAAATLAGGLSKGFEELEGGVNMSVEPEEVL